MIKAGLWQIKPNRTYLMGVLNVTPDSFSDGGQFHSVERAIAHAEQMLPHIDILDIGGESTRPGAESVSAPVEIDRIVPIIQALRQKGITIPISVDTTKALVAQTAITAGANVINDVSAGRFDPQMLTIAKNQRVPIILMHMQGEPRTMQANPQYADVLKEVKDFLTVTSAIAIKQGIPEGAIAIDPGIGFGKSLDHNLTLLRNLDSLKTLNFPLLVGVSRKSFIGKLCNQPDPQQRLLGTAAACSLAIANGADILRVHDAKEMAEVAKVADGICRVAAHTD